MSDHHNFLRKHRQFEINRSDRPALFCHRLTDHPSFFSFVWFVNRHNWILLRTTALNTDFDTTHIRLSIVLRNNISRAFTTSSIRRLLVLLLLFHHIGFVLKSVPNRSASATFVSFRPVPYSSLPHFIISIRDRLSRLLPAFFGGRTMAWRSHGRTNDELVDNLKRNGIFSNDRVATVMKQVDRANYCSINPYQDGPQSIGYSVTISAPHMHASALQLLHGKLKPGTLKGFISLHYDYTIIHAFTARRIQKGNRCLDVGSGSGYLTACMGLMVAPNGKAIGIDHIDELVEFSRKNIQKDQPQLLSSGVVELVGNSKSDCNQIKQNHACYRLSIIVIAVGDGRNGYESGGPYDAIHVGAAATGLPEKASSK